MAIIAYKDGIMASDSNGSSFNNLFEDITGIQMPVGEFRKIIKTSNGSLIGCVGNEKNCKEYLEWEGLDSNSIWSNGDRHFKSIIVHPDSKYYVISNSGVKTYQELDDFIAIGSGADLAIGAMYKNATAMEAAKIAIKYNDDCNGLINTVQNDEIINIHKNIIELVKGKKL